ncbi:MAG: nucleotide pyrophosphohydrolase [Anaerolineae bacterium]|jgi:NTP pyrophosphatase (non-canonical NTP hydrolase)
MADEATSLADLRDRVAQFVAERGWERFHSPGNLSQAITVEAAELLEQFLWLTSDQATSVVNDGSSRTAVVDELADVIIYALSLANALDVDVSEAVLEKLETNERRFPADVWRGRARDDGVA